MNILLDDELIRNSLETHFKPFQEAVTNFPDLLPSQQFEIALQNFSSEQPNSYNQLKFNSQIFFNSAKQFTDQNNVSKAYSESKNSSKITLTETMKEIKVPKRSISNFIAKGKIFDQNRALLDRKQLVLSREKIILEKALLQARREYQDKHKLLRSSQKHSILTQKQQIVNQKSHSNINSDIISWSIKQQEFEQEISKTRVKLDEFCKKAKYQQDFNLKIFGTKITDQIESIYNQIIAICEEKQCQAGRDENIFVEQKVEVNSQEIMQLKYENQKLKVKLTNCKKEIEKMAILLEQKGEKGVEWYIFK